MEQPQYDPQTSGPGMGLRANYSCGSLAAAEQLEALMHNRPNQGAAPPCGVMPGSEPQMNGLMNMNGAMNGMQHSIAGFMGAAPGQHPGMDPGVYLTV